ncbi:hypothetical protein [Haloferula sp. BvORR071]|uniref:hypothetical protein n=1 Tax=Haloferula sp. BvORR071 TaxID=1396141 RepID=UPI0005590189|nr:hypothetical protein [Haloferula sp. BvORR071]
MQWITLITAAPLDLAAIATASRFLGEIRLEDSPPRLAIDGAGKGGSCLRGAISFIPDAAIGNAFAGTQLALIHQIIPGPHYTILRFRYPADAESAIALLNSDSPALIHTEHGLLLSLNEVKHRIEQGENWLGG